MKHSLVKTTSLSSFSGVNRMEAVPGALKLLSCFLPPLKKHCSYVFSNKKHVKKLEDEVPKLENKMTEVNRRVENAKNQGEDVIKRVDEWQKEAEHTIGDSHNFLQTRRNSDAKCCFKFCYNISYLYKNSKEAASLNKMVNNKYNEAVSFHEVATPQLPQIIVSSAAACIEGFESRNRILAQIVNLLQNNEVNVIGIYGISGVGKTTLVDKLILQAKDQKLFDVVVKAFVSAEPKITDIQNQIADRIKLKFDAKSEQGRAEELHHVLLRKIENKENILVVLDDVQEALDFTVQVGIPRVKCCKVVITSWERDVLSARQIDAEEFIEVGVLEKDEARQLFMKSLGNYSGIICSDSQFNAIMVDLLEYCGGLPLQIVTLAGTLKGKDLHFWKDTADELLKPSGKKMEGMYQKVQMTIELNFNSLQNIEAQRLFLLCSHFLENAPTEMEKLMIFASENHLFGDDFRLDNATDRVYGLVDQLISCSLLSSVENDGGAFRLQMHDVVRDAAMDIASKATESEGRSAHRRDDEIATGPILFSKILSTTDVDLRLHVPSAFLSELPDFSGSTRVDFEVKDGNGELWQFGCHTRKGPYPKPVISTGWLRFVRSKNLKRGDKIIFYKSAHPDAHFDIRINRSVLLFGADINTVEE